MRMRGLAADSDVSPDTLNYLMDYYTEWLGAPPGLLAAIAIAESSYNPSTGYFRNVINWTGATGLMQLRPVAIADIRRVFGMNIDPRNPVQSIIGAAAMLYINRRYLRYYLRGVDPTWPAVVVAYNGGWRAGLAFMARGIAPSAEGRRYLAMVQANSFV